MGAVVGKFPCDGILKGNVPLQLRLRACLHGDGGPQVGEVTGLGGDNPPFHIISHFNLITFTC